MSEVEITISDAFRETLSGKSILLLEDVPETYEPLLRILTKHDAEVIHTVSGDRARELGIATRFDALLFDHFVKGMNGSAALIDIRKSGQGSFDSPALISTSLADVEHKTRLLAQYVDDYVIKPDESTGADTGVELELVARICACIRRSRREREAPNRREGVYENGPLVVDRDRRQAMLFGEPLKLTNRDFAILLELVSITAQLMTHDNLFARCWSRVYANPASWPDNWPSTLQRAVDRLRSVLRPYEERLPEGLRPLVLSVRGQGYVMRDLAGISV